METLQLTHFVSPIWRVSYHISRLFWCEERKLPLLRINQYKCNTRHHRSHAASKCLSSQRNKNIQMYINSPPPMTAKWHGGQVAPFNFLGSDRLVRAGSWHSEPCVLSSFVLLVWKTRLSNCSRVSANFMSHAGWTKLCKKLDLEL